MTEQRPSHLPQAFYSQLGIYLAVSIVLLLGAGAAGGAPWWYWLIPVGWAIGLAMYGAWLYWFDKPAVVDDELNAGRQLQTSLGEKEETVDWVGSAGEGSTGSRSIHP